MPYQLDRESDRYGTACDPAGGLRNLRDPLKQMLCQTIEALDLG
jgi:hypothetical protein